MQSLHNRDILYLPDFITNAGGALGNMLKFAGLKEKHLQGILDNEFTRELSAVLIQAKDDAMPPAELAFDRLNDKFTRMKARLELPGSKNALQQLALSAYRAGVIPSAVVRPLALRRIRGQIGI